MRTRCQRALALILVAACVPATCNDTVIDAATAWDGVTAASSTATSDLAVVIPPLFAVGEQRDFSIEYRGSSVCVYSRGGSREFRINTQAVADRTSISTRPITHRFEARAAGRTELSCVERPGFGPGTRIRFPAAEDIARDQLGRRETLLIALEPI